ncbi:MAG: TIGR04283 family arsenosugar biosynthesis glycosyltransferase [Candidatus Omnitrophota bacterium]
MISVIVPVYNEEKILKEKKEWFAGLSRFCELIFVDGNSSDNSAAIAENIGFVVKSKKCRGAQMNIGAKYAHCDILFFLHADASVSLSALKYIEEKIISQNLIGGCLSQRLSGKNLIFRIIELFGNLRARFTKIFYADQGIFVKRDTFYTIGGFPEVPIMEDAIFTEKLRRSGLTAMLPHKIFVSCRRWEKMGIVKTITLQSFLNILFMLKFPLNAIDKLYGDLR